MAYRAKQTGNENRFRGARTSKPVNQEGNLNADNTIQSRGYAVNCRDNMVLRSSMIDPPVDYKLILRS